MRRSPPGDSPVAESRVRVVRSAEWRAAERVAGRIAVAAATHSRFPGGAARRDRYRECHGDRHRDRHRDRRHRGPDRHDHRHHDGPDAGRNVRRGCCRRTARRYSRDSGSNRSNTAPGRPANNRTGRNRGSRCNRKGRTCIRDRTRRKQNRTVDMRGSSHRRARGSPVAHSLPDRRSRPPRPGPHRRAWVGSGQGSWRGDSATYGFHVLDM